MRKFTCIFFCFLITVSAFAQGATQKFNKDWKFFLGDDSLASQIKFDDNKWRKLSLPHDWSIEGQFSEKDPVTHNQAALPAGVGWYRKTFTIADTSEKKRVFISFDGIYRNSEVWINGHYLGKRPNGYVSFEYELTPYLKSGREKNVVAVRVDNSPQPNSRWYTGSGIYRNVWLRTTRLTAFEKWGTFIQTTSVSEHSASISIHSRLLNTSSAIDVHCEIFDPTGKRIQSVQRSLRRSENYNDSVYQFRLSIRNPKLWSVDSPVLYKAVLRILLAGNVMDQWETSFGIRYFNFDATKGFSLNGKPMKILGVCMHHDLGALGAAVNARAIERQLQILKKMGCNAIRTAHNPPAPEFLDLCDKMGFLVMDEAFDIWKKRKNRFDYSVDFNEWYKKDLEDMVKRDRNHPSVFMWSIGNEIREQFDSTGITIAKELVQIVKSIDTTRPVTCALTENIPEKNFIYQSGALDVLGFNYKLDAYPDLPRRFPGEKFVATETASAFATRGHYDMPSDSNRLWPPDSKPFKNGNPDYTVSAYDHVFAYWGATHEQSWNAVKKHNFIAGTFVWSGFDFLGEPVPYQWPARSSYYGIIDLAGFPKDVYYMYQSEWTNKPVLHLFPHWNWEKGKPVDVWAYYNNADEVELFLNGRSLGKKKKNGDTLHVMWRVNFEPGILKVVSKSKGKIVLTRQITTAGKPAKIHLAEDRKVLKANGEDVSFITVSILDANGNVVPYADNLIKFSVRGEAVVAGTDNGYQASLESFKLPERKAYNGSCLLIVRTTEKAGSIEVSAAALGLRSGKIMLVSKKD